MAKQVSNYVKGVKHPSAKMNVTKVRQARKSYATGKWSIADLAIKYGITPQSMSQILKRQTWKHVA